MNKKIIIGIIVVAVLGGGAYFLLTQSGSSLFSGGGTSLKDLLDSQTSQKCTFGEDVTGTSASGEIYVSGGKILMNFVELTNGQAEQIHTLVDGASAYIWSDTTNQGFKMSTVGMMGGVDFDQKFYYSCIPWVEDATLITLPQNVTFIENEAIVEQMTPPPTVSGQVSGSVSLEAQCALCDQATNDPTAKAQCRSALNCK
ncbi:MAG: hypothetical protein AAB691_03485 [Patescibacteria group bacterium]